MKTRPRLLAARLIWILFAIIFFNAFLTAVPALYAEMKIVCQPSPTSCPMEQVPAEIADYLAARQISMDTVALIGTALFTVPALIFWTVGLLIFWRRSDEWFGLLVAFMMIEFGATGPSFVFLAALKTVPMSPLLTVAAFAAAPFYLFMQIFLLTFPNGRFTPRWSAGLIGLIFLNYFVWATPNETLNLLHWPPVLASLWLILVYGSPLAIQVYRYRRFYTPEERQQTKWLISGFLVGLLSITVAGFLEKPETPAGELVSGLAGGIGLAFFYSALPVAVGIAILRYRLWDIDIIIRRTLIYSILTGILAAMYFSVVVLIQRVFQAAVGATPDAAIVISTLLIAALFSPIRRRVQDTIDRRFYRRKYDAEKTLAKFNQTLRDEVDIESLKDSPLSVVQETMQPTKVGLWLREPDREK